MKSLEDLKVIREQTKAKLENGTDIRIVVGMATCGIAAGARPVLNAFMDEVSKRNLTNVTVTQTGCLGVCRLEPLVEIYVPGQDKVTYIKMTEEKARQIVAEHIVNQQVVESFTIGAAE